VRDGEMLWKMNGDWLVLAANSSVLSSSKVIGPKYWRGYLHTLIVVGQYSLEAAMITLKKTKFSRHASLTNNGHRTLVGY